MFLLVLLAILAFANALDTVSETFCYGCWPRGTSSTIFNLPLGSVSGSQIGYNYQNTVQCYYNLGEYINGPTFDFTLIRCHYSAFTGELLYEFVAA